MKHITLMLISILTLGTLAGCSKTPEQIDDDYCTEARVHIVADRAAMDKQAEENRAAINAAKSLSEVEEISENIRATQGSKIVEDQNRWHDRQTQHCRDHSKDVF